MKTNPAQALPVSNAAQAVLAIIRDAMKNPGVDCSTEAGGYLMGDAMIDACANLEKALAAPIASRPTSIPDVASALATIDAMKAGLPIAPNGIQAVVALAEEGARQLDQFAVRFDADRRAVAAWAAAHPQMAENGFTPSRADLVVWLMEALDTTFTDPTVAKVNGVRARLGAARLRAPNQLTSDACDIIDQLVDALRKATRGEFMAQQRVAELERAVPGESALADHLDALGLLAEAQDQLEQAASDYADRDNGGGYRAASGLASKIEAFLKPDPLDQIEAQLDRAATETVAMEARPWAPHLDYAGEPMAPGEHRDPPAGQDDLHKRLVDILGRELGDAYDCTRVWEAWNVGTMTENDFEPVSDRIDDIAAALVAVIKPADLPEPTGEPVKMRTVETHRAGVLEETTIRTVYGERPRPGPADDSAFDALVDAARKGGVIDDALKTVWREPGEAGKLLSTKLAQLTGYSIQNRASSHDADEMAQIAVPGPAEAGVPLIINLHRDSDQPMEIIGGKNTADYDRRQMEDRINAELRAIADKYPGQSIGVNVAAEVARYAPGWEFQMLDSISSAFPKVVLTRYAPNEPI
jgi:hypothetical protein